MKRIPSMVQVLLRCCTTFEVFHAYVAGRGTEYEGKKLVLYGNIPGLSYYLDKPSAVYTTWPDLDSNSLAKLEEDLDRISLEIGEGGKSQGSSADRPLVILTPQLAAYFSGDQEAMAYWGTDEKACGEDPKLTAIMEFMTKNHYEQAFVFANDAFVMYE